MSVAFHFHDLKNKLGTVFFMLECSRRGRVLNDQQVSAVYERIQEILTEISLCLKLEPVKLSLEAYGHEDFYHFLEFAVQKLSNLYPEMKLTLNNDLGKWPEDVSVSLSKKKLFQVLDNAVENSKNALASQVQLTLTVQGSQPSLILSDDGEGFRSAKKPVSQIKLISGLKIISENLKEMKAVGAFSENPEGGAKLTITFNSEIPA